MGWEERLKDAVYVTPSGARLPFFYEDVRRMGDRHGSPHNFPDVKGTYVDPDGGHSGRRFPLRAIFWGDDCDLQADAFEAGLFENGIGTIEHPMYGTADVVPLGEIARNDRLVTRANEATVTVTLWETTGLIYPTGQTDPASEVAGAVIGFNAAAAGIFESLLDLDTAGARANFKSGFQIVLDTTSAALEGIAKTNSETQQQFDAIVSSINQGIDTLVSEPLTLAAQTVLMIQAPARASAGIVARLDAYGNLAAAIVNRAGGPTSDNDFHTQDLYASAYVTGSVVSVVNTQFETKREAIEAAEAVLAQMDAVTEWRDLNFPGIDTGESYQQLRSAVDLAAGFLVEISFTLQQERIIVLDRARSIIDLTAELYGEIDGKLDFLINSNGLSGAEIIELPVGRSIVYYV